MTRSISRTKCGWLGLLAWCAGILFQLWGAEAAEVRVTSKPMIGGKPAQQLVLDVTGVTTLVLRASGYSWGQAVWGEPILVGLDQRTNRLTDLKPLLAQVGWGDFTLNAGPTGKPLKVAGREFKHGFFAHADSTLRFQLDGKYRRFEAWVGINETALAQGRVVFEVLDAEGYEWQQTVKQFRNGFSRDALASLRRAVEAETAAGRLAADRAGSLRQRLGQYEAGFEGIRTALDHDADKLKSQLEAFQALVKEIRLLKLNAPLLFVKRHPYFAQHIYDDYLEWHPGGGVYIIENPSAPMENQVVRAVVDPKSAGTPGEGVYRVPDLSFDARRLLFAFKGEPKGDTRVYEVGLDGGGVRRLTDPTRGARCQDRPPGLIGEGHHDYSPCHLPGGRIAFLSTRTAGLVMCFNNHIATLHTMNCDGSDVRSISVNNVTEFDPTLLPDGRILFGRWEYVDKTALYMQSLWTVDPDGTQETALFKNNLAKPTAVLDARPVPGSDLIVASLTPHNGQSVGAIAMIDPLRGKNNLAAITNFTPEYPTEMDQGLRRGPCDPWPLDEDTVLIANDSESHGSHGVIELIDRYGFRFVIHRERDISCYSPMLIKPQPEPPVRSSAMAAGQPARFFLNDVYQGMPGVSRGAVKRLRVIETTSRVSGIPQGGRWWNQAFLVSWQGSYDVKNILGVVPVEADGSAWFEAPPGKALYFQALDGDGRLVQSMRTFVQAAPGVTRSCQGCHVADDNVAGGHGSVVAMALKKPPQQIQPESWGHGFLDYAAQVQPVLDRHCVSCHGGAKGISDGIDLSGGWTMAFNISYETLLKNTLAGFLNCENGSVRTAEILPPRAHGSGIAPLADLLAQGHQGRLDGMSAGDRQLLLAWMDGNCNYYGTWNYSEYATNAAILNLREPVLAEMEKAGCLRCHEKQIGNDWINLQQPAWSRLLRAPMAQTNGGLGLGWCRQGKARTVRTPLVTQKQQPPDVFKPARDAKPAVDGTPATTFSGTNHVAYQNLLRLIQFARQEALKQPRVDMPGAVVTRGQCRDLLPLSPPVLRESAALGPKALDGSVAARREN